jgi:hypothetical protein
LPIHHVAPLTISEEETVVTHKPQDLPLQNATAEDGVRRRCTEAAIAAQCGRVADTVSANRELRSVRSLSAVERTALLAQVNSAMMSLSSIRSLLL